MGDNGGKHQRRSAEDFQVGSHCVVVKQLIVVGRDSIVSEVEVNYTMCTPSCGPVLISELGVSVSVRQMVSMMVAVVSLAAPSCGRCGGPQGAPWDEVARTVTKEVVRLVAEERWGCHLEFRRDVRVHCLSAHP